MNNTGMDPLELGADVDPRLSTRLSRFRALWEAWGVLAPSGLSDSGQRIAEEGRALSRAIEAVALDRDSIDEIRLESLDTLLDEFETSMRNIASRVPIPELRLTLPRFLGTHRSGLLALLDVLVGSDPDSDRASDGRIFAIDYLISLLCGKGNEPGHGIAHDPVTLTPRLEALCAHADARHDSTLSATAAEYFVASSMSAEDLRQEFQQRHLRSRKAELGTAFFASSILRAIVTYNAALYERIAGEIIESGDWGLSRSKRVATDSPAASLYQSEPLREIAAGARRRAEDREPNPGAADRIAWALDFEHLSALERKALCRNGIGRREDPLGTAILVGLICRSLAVLSIDLQDIGIAPDDVAEKWVAELRTSFQVEINAHLAKHDYKMASALSELKDRFLSVPLDDHLRSQRAPAESIQRPVPVAPTPSNPRPESARELVMAALDGDRNGDEIRKSTAATMGPFPWLRIAQAACLVLMLGAGLFFLFGREPTDLARMNDDQLANVSMYLTDGRRSGSGAGEAFVGAIDDSWTVLPKADREAIAEALVSRLRQQNIHQIMIYDADSALRIQAVGSQPVRAL